MAPFFGHSEPSLGDMERARKRVLDNVSPEPMSGCWLWLGKLNHEGYGRSPGKPNGAHRYSYQAFVGPIPAGLHLDHKCRVRCCVNPDHLEPVTPRENALRGIGFAAINAKKTHCPKGHPYSGKNLIGGDGRRECRACQIAYKRRAREAKAAQRPRVDRRPCAVHHIFSPIPGFTSYEISNTGWVLSLPRTVIKSDGERQFIPGGLLTPLASASGHAMVSLRERGGNQNRSVCHLLRRAFGLPINKAQRIARATLDPDAERPQPVLVHPSQEFFLPDAVTTPCHENGNSKIPDIFAATNTEHLSAICHGEAQS